MGGKKSRKEKVEVLRRNKIVIGEGSHLSRVQNPVTVGENLEIGGIKRKFGQQGTPWAGKGKKGKKSLAKISNGGLKGGGYRKPMAPDVSGGLLEIGGLPENTWGTSEETRLYWETVPPGRGKA